MCCALLGVVHRRRGSGCRAPRAIWSPTRYTGFQEFMAPWKTIAMSFHRRWRISSAAEAEQVLAVEPDLTRDELGVGGKQAQQRERDRGLSAARLSDQADRLALVDGERHVLDRRDLAGLDLVVHDQLVHLEQRLGGVDRRAAEGPQATLRHRLLCDAHLARSRGLITSSMPRPTRKKAKHRNETASPAGKSSHQ